MRYRCTLGHVSMSFYMTSIYPGLCIDVILIEVSIYHGSCNNVVLMMYRLSMHPGSCIDVNFMRYRCTLGHISMSFL